MSHDGPMWLPRRARSKKAGRQCRPSSFSPPPRRGAAMKLQSAAACSRARAVLQLLAEGWTRSSSSSSSRWRDSLSPAWRRRTCAAAHASHSAHSAACTPWQAAGRTCSCCRASAAVVRACASLARQLSTSLRRASGRDGSRYGNSGTYRSTPSGPRLQTHTAAAQERRRERCGAVAKGCDAAKIATHAACVCACGCLQRPDGSAMACGRLDETLCMHACMHGHTHPHAQPTKQHGRGLGMHGDPALALIGSDWL